MLLIYYSISMSQTPYFHLQRKYIIKHLIVSEAYVIEEVNSLQYSLYSFLFQTWILIIVTSTCEPSILKANHQGFFFIELFNNIDWSVIYRLMTISFIQWQNRFVMKATLPNLGIYLDSLEFYTTLCECGLSQNSTLKDSIPS